MNKIKMALLVAGIFTVTFASKAQTIEEVLQKAEQLKLDFVDSPALLMYEKAYAMDSTNFEAIWNVSYMNTRIGWLQPNKTIRVNFYKTALVYAQKAIEMKPEDPDANFVLGASIGGAAEKDSPKSRITSAYEVKEYFDHTVEHDPENHFAWYSLGRWHYEIDNASSIEKAFANAFFGGLPDGASTVKAIEAYKNAIKIFPEYVVYYFDFARALKANDQKEAAVKMLRKAMTLPEQAPEEKHYKEKCQKLLDKWAD